MASPQNLTHPTFCRDNIDDIVSPNLKTGSFFRFFKKNLPLIFVTIWWIEW